MKKTITILGVLIAIVAFGASSCNDGKLKYVHYNDGRVHFVTVHDFIYDTLSDNDTVVIRDRKVISKKSCGTLPEGYEFAVVSSKRKEN
jgi:hypothetical protein